MFCPNQCVCQRSPFMDLSVSRWIQAMRREDVENKQKDTERPYGGIFNDVTRCDFQTFFISLLTIIFNLRPFLRTTKAI